MNLDIKNPKSFFTAIALLFFGIFIIVSIESMFADVAGVIMIIGSVIFIALSRKTD